MVRPTKFTGTFNRAMDMLVRKAVCWDLVSGSMGFDKIVSLYTNAFNFGEISLSSHSYPDFESAILLQDNPFLDIGWF